ncbi:histidinol-phosphate transaminase [Candidatus Woesearchaeota archaeon]|nr:histidinol-phosphate transaminase [Candidatus Woesearchaeota archaeon]
MAKQIFKPAKRIEFINPYNPADSLWKIKKAKGKKQILKLDWNESPFPPSKNVINAIKEFLSKKNNINWYPETFSLELRRELSKHFGLKADNYLVTNGCDDGLDFALRAFLNPKDEVIILSPTYTNFEIYVQTLGNKIKNITYDNSLLINIQRIEKSISKKTKLVYIANPNNPTGTLINKQDINRLLKKFPHVLFLIDETYYDFSNITVIGLIKSHSNLIIARSFSKAYALAGLRVGYLISQKENIDSLLRIYNARNVNVIAQIAAIHALRDKQYLKNCLNKIKASMDFLVKELNKLKIKVIATPTNFILVKSNNPKKLVRLLDKEFLFVRDKSDMPQLKGFIRLNLGDIKMAKHILKLLRNIKKKHSTLFA